MEGAISSKASNPQDSPDLDNLTRLFNTISADFVLGVCVTYRDSEMIRGGNTCGYPWVAKVKRRGQNQFQD